MVEQTAEIESALQTNYPGHWRALNAEEVRQYKKHTRLDIVVGWHIRLDTGKIRHRSVDGLVVVVDSNFPDSQPRIIASNAPIDFSWPHIEANGLLCLKPSSTTAPAAARVIDHISWGLELLNFDDDQCRSEFHREISNYWNNKSSAHTPSILAVFEPEAASSVIYSYMDQSRAQLIVAQSKEILNKWLKNYGHNPKDKDLKAGYCLWLKKPWTPDNFPERGKDVFALVNEITDIEVQLSPGEDLPILFAGENGDGVFLVGGILKSAVKGDLSKGFRHISKVPENLIYNSFSTQKFLRSRIVRADILWVHSRVKETNIRYLTDRKVAIVGCGSLGSAVAKLLVQEGVGSFIFVDPDVLAPSNASRHLLGQKYAGDGKADALKKELLQNFPHIKSIQLFSKKFGDLVGSELKEIEECDVVLAAGLDFEGDMHIANWRLQTEVPPAHISAWLEAYAVAGHVVTILGKDSLRDGFDNEKFRYRASDNWPANSLPVEPGCGNRFQPHSSIDMMPVVGMTARTVIDFLMGRHKNSFRKVWFTSKETITGNGGNPYENYVAENSISEHTWIVQ